MHPDNEADYHQEMENFKKEKSFVYQEKEEDSKKHQLKLSSINSRYKELKNSISIHQTYFSAEVATLEQLRKNRKESSKRAISMVSKLKKIQSLLTSNNSKGYSMKLPKKEGFALIRKGLKASNNQGVS